MPEDVDDTTLAVRLATSALRLLQVVRGDGTLTGRLLGDAGDAASNAFLVRALQQARPADAVLSEEETDGAERLGHSRVWVVDPLDGTREYAEGRDDWAVHVALAVDGVPAACAVAQLDGTRSSADPQPGWQHGGRPRVVVSRTRPPAVARLAAEAIGGELVPMGSAGAKVLAVVRGDADAYVHAGGMHEWDSCAPAGVALAAGLHASRLDGSPLRYNRPDPLLPDLLVCRPDLAETLLEALR